MEIWDDVRPDLICTDNVTGFPAVELAGCPWARFVSANPLEMRDPSLPPPLSGLPVGDRSEWEAFRAEYRPVHAELLAEHNEFRRSVGARACPPDEFNTHSPSLNLYLFPEAADYSALHARSTPRGTGFSPPSARPTRRSTSMSICPARASWSTSRSARSAAWTSVSCSA